MWQYKTETFNSLLIGEASLKKRSDEILEEAGKEGWELVNFQCAGGFGSMMIFVFKKKVEAQ
jgi:hypothetical protein